MKKYLPLILLLLGAAFFVVVFFVVRNRNKPAEVAEDEVVAEIPFDQRPYVSMTPSEDGHYLKLEITNVKASAVMLDYELLYKVEDGRTAGVPGTVDLTKEKEIERDILLGSESSGKFRYDEGVEEGTLSLRFRNDKGKLTGKLVTDFHLQSGISELASVDGKFAYTLSEESEEFFVTMETFGLPAEASAKGGMVSGPYGIFASSTSAHPGIVEMDGDVYQLVSGDWQALSSNKASDVGVFVGVSSE